MPISKQTNKQSNNNNNNNSLTQMLIIQFSSINTEYINKMH
jgi:hypothetical protein